MSALSGMEVTGKAAVLQIAFGEGWRDLLRAVVWELVDKALEEIDENSTLFTLEKWFVKIPVRGAYAEWAIVTVATLLVGKRA